MFHSIDVPKIEMVACITENLCSLALKRDIGDKMQMNEMYISVQL